MHNSRHRTVVRAQEVNHWTVIFTPPPQKQKQTKKERLTHVTGLMRWADAKRLRSQSSGALMGGVGIIQQRQH